jgi:hypothetical protein
MLFISSLNFILHLFLTCYSPHFYFSGSKANSKKDDDEEEEEEEEEENISTLDHPKLGVFRIILCGILC